MIESPALFQKGIVRMSDENKNENRNNVPDRIPLYILIGIAILIAIAGMNLYETHQQRGEINDRLTQVALAINSRPAGNPAPARPSGPDPEKVYTVKTEGAPWEGSRSAPVQIVEISDFQ